MIFDKVALFFLAINKILYALLYVEFWSLPSISKTLSILTGELLPSYLSLALIFVSLFVLPTLSSLLVLASFKKFIFNHSKDAKKNYRSIVSIICISYTFLLFFEILGFFINLAFKSLFYFRIRTSNYFLHSYFPYSFMSILLFILIFQSSCFMIGFLITELLIAFKLMIVTITMQKFVLKNIKIIVIVATFVLFNTVLTIFFQRNFMQFSKEEYNKLLGFTDKLVETLKVNFLMMYAYSIYVLNIE